MHEGRCESAGMALISLETPDHSSQALISPGQYSTDLRPQDLVLGAQPSFLTRAAIKKTVDTASAAPQKDCKDVQLIFTKAPAIGFPISRPADTGTKSIPIRTPMTLNDGQSVMAQGGVRATKAPETNP